VAHGKPAKILNKGDAWRLNIASSCFIIELCTDDRVNAHYEEWRDFLVFVLQRTDELQLDEEGEKVAYATHDRMSLERLQTFVRDNLRLDEGWADWVAWALFDAFQIRHHNERHPEGEPRYSIPVRMRTDAPLGKRPPQDGKDLERNVRWFYRNKVKVPSDSIHAMARDYSTWVTPHRENDCRSVVQNAIKQVQGLLDLAATHYRHDVRR
jgi:hypothetical protein